MDNYLVLDKFAIDTGVLDFGNKDVILGLSWWMEHGFSVYNQSRYLSNISIGHVIRCSIR